MHHFIGIISSPPAFCASLERVSKYIAGNKGLIYQRIFLWNCSLLECIWFEIRYDICPRGNTNDAFCKVCHLQRLISIDFLKYIIYIYFFSFATIGVVTEASCVHNPIFNP